MDIEEIEAMIETAEREMKALEDAKRKLNR